MFRNLVRIVPVALAGFKWWQKRKADKANRTGQPGPASPQGQSGTDTSTR